MASHLHSARHEAARKTILIWLGGVILVAGIGTIVTYDSLRDQSAQFVPAAAPLLSKKNSTMPQRLTEQLAKKKQVSDSTADVERAHKSAVADSKGAEKSIATEQSKPAPAL